MLLIFMATSPNVLVIIVKLSYLQEAGALHRPYRGLLAGSMYGSSAQPISQLAQGMTSTTSGAAMSRVSEFFNEEEMADDPTTCQALTD